ncbi:MAG TPA: HEAT repeat domain-containing protein [Archangium sp.]|uniref:HEAT repeat domain-containing protein n=1 Tax=Archangium sp. TaxID=1872627 RepID=UPI002E36822D|nr:HEAT repeat domain-containing protein [Archangium sp.]HEX5748601.1 HEAT repeat domain-containing protein [Archangium sp.]
MTQLGTRKARPLLEEMLTHPDALVRQAAAFGLGALGGAASARRLEQQLAIEEARDADGESVVEAITQALGRITESGARTTLVRRLERLVTGKPDPGDVSALAHALWRKRHPDLLPSVRRGLKRLEPLVSRPLHGLLMLLEKSPEELRQWALDPAIPVGHKTGVLSVLEEELPESLVSALPPFISVARSLSETAARHQGEASYYCDRLLILLLLHEERVLPTLPPESRAELRDLARTLVAATALNCALRAASLLKFVGQPEDADIIEAHRPAEPVLARVFDDAARALRNRPVTPAAR